MKKLYNLLVSNFLARYIFLLTFVITIITLFGNIEIKEFPKIIFFIKLSFVFLFPLFINILFVVISKLAVNNMRDSSDIQRVLNHRMGSQISLRTLEEKEYDNIHKYTLLYRQDQLNFNQYDYNSFRVLKGVNKSKGISSFLIYSESSDIPIEFEKIVIKAKNNINGKILAVECLHSVTDKRLQHSFKINFDQPIRPNQQFDISYSITIANEMTVYSKDKEIQSISLVRIKKPLEKLVFNICLNYEPKAVKLYAKRVSNGLVEIDGATVNRYLPSTDLHNSYNIDWGNSTPYIIETEINHPNYDQYIIEFIK